MDTGWAVKAHNLSIWEWKRDQEFKAGLVYRSPYLKTDREKITDRQASFCRKHLSSQHLGG